MSLCGMCGAPATVGSMCATCVARAELRIRDTPGLLCDLDVTITKQAKQAAPGPGGGSDRMVLNLAASEAGTELRAAWRVFAGKHDPTVREVIDGFRASVRHPDTPERVTRLDLAFKTADRVRDTPVEKFTYGHCTCGRKVTAPRDRDHTTCPECGARLDLADWRAAKAREAMARVPEFEGTVKEALIVLSLVGYTVKRGNVDRWVHEGKLKPVEPGKRIYRVKEIADLAGIVLT